MRIVFPETSVLYKAFCEEQYGNCTVLHGFRSSRPRGVDTEGEQNVPKISSLYEAAFRETVPSLHCNRAFHEELLRLIGQSRTFRRGKRHTYL